MTHIQTESPLAFAAFETWLIEKITAEGYYGVELYCDPSGALHITWEEVTERERTTVSFPLPEQFIYQWLDEQGVIVQVYNVGFEMNDWEATVKYTDGKSIFSPLVPPEAPLFPDRPAATTAAFTKAFSIIQSQLEGETNDRK